MGGNEVARKYVKCRRCGYSESSLFAVSGQMRWVEPIAPHVAHQDDLFDPMKNENVLAAANYSGEDETEGTGETAAPHPSEVESQRDPLVDASPLPPRRMIVNRLSRKVHKFKKGKYRR